MDHAEARERMEAAILERTPRGRGIEPADAEQLRAHLQACAACRAEADALDLTDRLLRAADRPSPETRARVLAAAAATRATGPARPVRRVARFPAFRVPAPALAAAAIVLALGGGFAAGRVLDSNEPAPGQGLARITALSDRVLREPGHREAVLRGRDGSPAGSVLFGAQSGQLIVISDALAPLPADTRYRCYLERDGERYPIGQMYLGSGLAYWAGRVGATPTDLGRAGDRFVVVAEPGGGEPVLSGEF